MRKLTRILLAIVSTAASSPCPAADQVAEAAAGPRPWADYRTIMWVEASAWKDPQKVGLFFQRLKEMGINTGMVYGDGDLRPYQEHRFPYYVENLVNRGLCLKFNSKVTDWDKFVTQWAKDGRPESALVRDYCLDDPAWLDWARREVRQIASKNRAHSPIAYDLRDELSVTISANPFDYDFGPVALAAFRVWLRERYPSLEALNRQWETRFEAWEQVRPFTTDQIKNRMGSGKALPEGKPDWGEVQALRFDPVEAVKSPTRWNFSPWADFRTYMDVSLARALNELRKAAREVDPATPVGIEGTQMPHAFGGYDLWRLSQVIDWVEPYDIGNAREIFGSFMPGRPMVATVFEKETNPARRRLWHLLLEGDRGCIIWWSQDCIDWKHPDYALTAKGKALAPVLQEMTSDLGRLFLRAQRVRDPVLIHYSQPSIQVNWLLESTVDGSTWLRRFSSFEADHNKLARVRNGWLKVFQDLGYAPRFISSEEIEQGSLPEKAVLVLPGSLALSDREAAEIRKFAGGQGRVLYDGAPGWFDEHGKLRARPAVSELVGRVGEVAVAGGGKPRAAQAGDIARYAADRLRAEGEPALPEWVRNQLGEFLPLEVTVAEPGKAQPGAARVRVHRFRAKQVQLLGFEQNINYQMSEDLKQAGGNEALEKAREIEARLPSRRHVYDLKSGKYLGQVDRVRLTLSPWQPTLLAVSADELPAGRISAELLK